MFTKLRFGMIDINKNKKLNNPNHDETCPFCPNRTENEYHFLLQCPQYEELRNKYIKRYWITLNNVQVKDLINNEEQITKMTATYTFYAAKLREESI